MKKSLTALDWNLYKNSRDILNIEINSNFINKRFFGICGFNKVLQNFTQKERNIYSNLALRDTKF